MTEQTKRKPQADRINDKYGLMCDYYASLLARCHQSIRTNEVLSKLDPMGQKTSATSLFIRVCSRMDEAQKERLTPDNMLKMSAVKTEAKQAVNS
jgi:hypothetical protein